MDTFSLDLGNTTTGSSPDFDLNFGFFSESSPRFSTTPMSNNNNNNNTIPGGGNNGLPASSSPSAQANTPGGSSIPISLGTPTGIASLSSDYLSKTTSKAETPTTTTTDTTTSENTLSEIKNEALPTTTAPAPYSTTSPSTVSQSSARPHLTTIDSTTVNTAPVTTSSAINNSFNSTMAAPSPTQMMQNPSFNQMAMPQQQQHPQLAMQQANVQYSNEMNSIQQQLMMKPDLIPPPPHVVQAGQQYLIMAARMGNPQQMYLPQHMQMLQTPQNTGNTSTGVNANNPYYNNPAAMMMQQQQQVAGGGAMRQQHLMQQRAQLMGAMPGTAATPVNTAWQSESDIPLRRKMIAKIVSLLQQRKPDAPEEWVKKLPDMARRLEDSLYRTATGRNEYGNFYSLKHRLQQLAITMGAKSAGMARANNPAAAATSSAMQQQMMQQQQQQQRQMQLQRQQQFQMQEMQRQAMERKKREEEEAAAAAAKVKEEPPTSSHELPVELDVDSDFMNFALSPSMGGTLDFDLERKGDTPKQEANVVAAVENFEDTKVKDEDTTASTENTSPAGGNSTVNAAPAVPDTSST